jgi:hypothetical protein
MSALKLFMSQTPAELAGGFAMVLTVLAMFAALWIVTPN